MVSVIKKSVLSFALASAFGVSANAACDSIFCIGGKVGIGVAYSDFGGNSTIDGNLTSGYGALDIDLLFIRRLKFGLGFKVGAGSINLSGSSLSSTSNHTTSAFGDLSMKIGFNVASLESPLYINFMMFTANSAISSDFVQGVGIIGVEFEGKKQFSEKTYLLYSLGGGVANGAYGNKNINFEDIMSNKLGYGLFGSLGLEYSLTSYLGFYVKGTAKFYDINASKETQINGASVSFPATKAWVAMAEAGITF